MDTTLATVTIISLLLAWAMAIVTWQRIRAERRLSDARAAALMAELTGDAAPPDGPSGRPERRPPIVYPAAAAGEPPPRPRRAPVELRLPFTAPEEAPGARGETPRATAPGGGRARHDAAAPRSNLWREVLAPTPPAQPHWGHRLAAVAVGTVLVAGVSLATRAPGPRDPTAAAVPVELLSLDHRKQGDYLAVSGSLRNPPGGQERAKLSITATVFDRTGAVIGTGQTPLPVTVLPPGGETAFTISLPDADLINRYRVSFMEDQASLPHVDRRHSDAPGDAAMPASVGSRP